MSVKFCDKKLSILNVWLSSEYFSIATNFAYDCWTVVTVMEFLLNHHSFLNEIEYPFYFSRVIEVLLLLFNAGYCAGIAC